MRIQTFLAATAAFALLLAARVPTAPVDENWPQWRGPAGLGVSAGTNYPEEWSPETNIAWKMPVEGSGHSSPVIWGEALFITTAIQGQHVPGRVAPDHLDFNLKPGYLHPDAAGVDYKNTLKVLAYDTRNGQLLWERTAYDGLMYDNKHKKNTYASPTIATDGKLLYAFFEAAGIYAYDLKGKLAWKASVGDIAKAGLGPGTSPVLFEDLLILQCDQEMGTGSAIIALDKKTGKQVWRVDRSTRRSWATPVIVQSGGRAELVASGAEMVIGYDPRTGKELWRAPGVQSHPIPSIVAGHGLIFATAGNGAKVAMAIRAGSAGQLKENEGVVWRYNKGTAYVPSPILFGDDLYLMTEAGLITCLDARTGTVRYEGGRPPVATSFKSSLVAYGDRVLQTSEEGDTFVIKAGPKHEVLRTNSIGEPVWASLAFARDTIFIRGEKHLFAIRNAALATK
ncbi:MAG: PQQ-binding-like beta-propeller repeat protein [Vicinamibacterales bacterium]